MSNPSKQPLLVATLGRSVGLRGDMKLHIKSDFTHQFSKGATFFTSSGDTLTIERVDPKRSLVKIQGYNTKEEAKRLANTKLYTTIERTRKECELKEGEYFWFDIIGCKLYEDGMLLGEVIDIERIATIDYLLIATAKSLVQKDLPKRFMLAYDPRHILKVDIENKQLEVQGGYDILEAS